MQDHLFVFSEYIQNELRFKARRSFSLLKLWTNENNQPNEFFLLDVLSIFSNIGEQYQSIKMSIENTIYYV